VFLTQALFTEKGEKSLEKVRFFALLVKPGFFGVPTRYFSIFQSLYGQAKE